ncbi:hypothetical protein EW145_g4346 [Phellinidium pouzarii]|uniref:Uncharacterized protein n=1 Tax=Phellinidium pouzarii TaxID=167371 RepID=A0A4S4L8X4_9AGAM|nr:hypothetical protein EW145_g4346 [Phellinidium pouzarii]
MQKKYNRYTLYDVPLFPSHQTGAPTYKLTHNLLAIFVGLDMLLLGIGITLIALSLVWMSAGLIQSMVLTREDLLAVLVLGGLFVATFLLSLPALLYTSSLSPVEEFSSTKLVVLNMTLCLDQVVVVLVGVIIWWRTLQERATFFQYWKNEDEDFRQSLEAKVL